MAPNCSSVHYTILTSRCGDCPATTRSTSVTCSVELSAIAVVCIFSVQSVVCGGSPVDTLDPLNVTRYVVLSHGLVFFLI